MNEDNNRDLERLFSLYETNLENFRKVYGILVGLGLFFLLIVVLQYFLNIYQYDQTKIKILNENKTIQQEIIRIQNYSKKVNSAQRQIEFYAKTINDTKAVVSADLKKANSLLSRARELLPNIDNKSVTKTLSDMLNKTQNKGDETSILAHKVLQHINYTLSSSQKKIESLNQTLSSANHTVTVAKINHDRDVKDVRILNDSINSLTDRWNEIQTPLGNLPIDFTSLLAVFPIGLSAGFLISSVWLAESIRLRMILHQIRDEDNKKQGSHIKVKTYLIAPLWIDPANPKQNRAIQFLLLAVPMIIFVISVVLISFAWEHAPTPPFPTGTDVGKYVYYSLYLACSGIFAYSFWRLLIGVRCYDKFIQSGNL
jgi:hypothetical protein